MMSIVTCLPLVDTPILFTTLVDACHCGTLVATFGLIDYTIGPASSFVEFCYAEETPWRALIRYSRTAVEVTSLLLFLVSLFYIFGIRKKKRFPIYLFMTFICINNVALLLEIFLLLVINIIVNDEECDYPNIKCKDVVVRTSVKIIKSVFYLAIYTYSLMLAKSYVLIYCLTPEKKSQQRKATKDTYNAPVRIIDSDASSSQHKPGEPPNKPKEII